MGAGPIASCGAVIASEISSSTASSQDGMIRLLLVIDGRLQEFLVPRHVAASLIANLAKALS